VLLQDTLADAGDTDAKTVQNLAHFTIQAMLVESERRSFGELPPVTASTQIGAPHFLAACRSADDIPYRVMMELLDIDRSRGLGERLFFPAALWQAMSAATASNQHLPEKRATSSQHDDSIEIKELQEEVVAYQTENEESLAQLSFALKGAMQDINNLRSDLDLAREEMQTAYKDLNLTRLELEHSKKELERTPRSESEIPNMQQKTIEPASPKLPEMTSISSLPRDWFKEIEQV